MKNPNRLTLNQKLLIPHSPDDEIVLEEVRTRKARLAEKQRKVKPLEVTTYTVANGDSLWSISNTFSLEIDTLFGSNDLKDPNVLKPGKQLRIPNQDGIFYTVKKGDTLDSIVKKFQISIDKVKEINESRVDLAILKIGEELFLPKPVQKFQPLVLLLARILLKIRRHIFKIFQMAGGGVLTVPSGGGVILLPAVKVFIRESI